MPRDSEGWTTFTPTANTRIVYISASEGDNSTGEFYSANEIIGDVFNPTGTTRGPIQPLRNPDVPGWRVWNQGVFQIPLWVLLKRGDTWEGRSLTRGGQPIGGLSPTEPVLFSAYGTGPRPQLRADGEFTGDLSGKVNLAVVGLHFSTSNRQRPLPPGVALGGNGANQ